MEVAYIAFMILGDKINYKNYKLCCINSSQHNIICIFFYHLDSQSSLVMCTDAVPKIGIKPTIYE
jgi:hypothetical protein